MSTQFLAASLLSSAIEPPQDNQKRSPRPYDQFDLSSQWTPPQTPLSASYSDIETPELEQGGFSNYLRAFYPYQPASAITSGEGDSSSVTVPIDTGDVILVHSVQPNGWADGTVLTSGARGWLPTNYCEAYDPDLMHNLLDALTYTWEFVRGHEEDDPQIFKGQDYMRGMIAGIRLLLQRTNCLSRDEPLIKTVHLLRRARRYMLSDLSSFSKAATSLQQLCLTDLHRDAFYERLDEIVMKAFKVTTQAVKFLDAWQHHIASQRSDENTPPLTPPMRLSGEPTGYGYPTDVSCAVENETQSQDGSEQNTTEPFPTHYSGVSTPMSPELPATMLSKIHDSDSLDALHPSHVTPTKRQSSLQHHRRTSASHRLSYSSRCPTDRERKFASDALTAAHDSFLSSLGVFTGLHLQSRASVELLSETKQAVLACSALLDVIEDIMVRDNTRSRRSLNDCKERMKLSLANLIQTLGEQSADGDHFLISGADSAPIQAATACVRSASACVAEASAIVHRVGDFEVSQNVEAVGLGLTSTTQAAQAGQKEKPRPIVVEEGFEVVEKPFSATPPQSAPLAQTRTQTQKQQLPERLPLKRSTTTPAHALGAPFEMVNNSSRTSCDTVLRPKSSSEPLPRTDSTVVPSLDLDLPFRSPICLPGQFQQSPEQQGASRGVSFTSTNSTDMSSLRFSSSSSGSTVATSLNQSPVIERSSLGMKGSFCSLSESHSTIAGELEDDENQLLTTTYAHELVLNQEGQVAGGSLPALVERLTIHDVTPDAMFVNTFYLTFRQFCTPAELARCLHDRFDYVNASPAIAKPVHLRIYNVLKGWLEHHWQPELDLEAIPVIEQLALGSLKVALPTASARLVELLAKASQSTEGGRAARVNSLQGKTNTVIGSTLDADALLPNPIVSRSQMNLLKKFELKTATCSILDFDPLEMARQFTLIESRIFCQITPDELLDGEFGKASGVSKAVHVKAMSKLSTDLANLVTDTILQPTDPKKRAIVLKQWVKIAKKCRELNNYDSLVAIVSALNSSMIARLKKTWELVSPKTVARLEEMRPLTEGRMTPLRKLLENHGAPCIPFVGLTLTDLTMNHEGNPRTRKLGRSISSGINIPQGPIDERSVINFDRYMKVARFIGDLQRFQVPYRLTPIPEMQAWMEAQIRRVGHDKDATPGAYWRRSVMLEPRAEQPSTNKSSPDLSSASASFSSTVSGNSTHERNTSAKLSFWGSLGLPAGNHSKDKLSSFSA